MPAPGVRIERTASWVRTRRSYQQLLPRKGSQFGEKGSNLHCLGQSQVAYQLAYPRIVLFCVTPTEFAKFGEKGSNPHDLGQSQVVSRHVETRN